MIDHASENCVTDWPLSGRGKQCVMLYQRSVVIVLCTPVQKNVEIEHVSSFSTQPSTHHHSVFARLDTGDTDVIGD